MTFTDDRERPIARILQDWAAEFDRLFMPFFDSAEEVSPELAAAMRYAALGGGKRLRPFLAARWCEIAGGSQADALPVCAAIECVHAFSLVHDDLPAMDDDELRRGRPSTHKKFGEGIAILAGDALLALAFEIIARDVQTPERSRALSLELARAAGPAGMIGGQAADLLGVSESPNRETIDLIHRCKTGRLFEAACRMGVLAGGGERATLSAAGDYGCHLGRAFQIADDLLDVTATTDRMGKRVGKDAGAGKQTYPSTVGISESRAAAAAAALAASEIVAACGEPAEDLGILATFVIERQH